MKLWVKLLLLLGFIVPTIIGLDIFSFIGKDKKEVIINDQDEVTPEIKPLFYDYYDEAKDKLATMTLEEKIGQLFLITMREDKAIDYINKYSPGGFVLFAADFKDRTKQDIIKKINEYQKISSVPLIIAVDEEGGTVTRVSSYSSFRNERFPSSQELYSQGGWSLIEKIELEKDNLLKELGINLNFAPVADVVTDQNAYMYKRSFGQNATKTSEYISRVIRIDRAQNFASTLKHFPGYGNNLDTHAGISIDNRSYEEFVNNDYLPFKAGIEKQVPVIMMSHNIVNVIDNKLPSSLSSKMHQELRDKLNFTGLIITDDLSMGAITKYVEQDKRSTLAFTAGNDLIITGNINLDYSNLLESVRSGVIDEKKIDKAVQRIIAFKYQYGILK